MKAILWLQSFRSPFLDQFFQLTTFFGEGYFYLLVLPILFWGWGKKESIWMAFVLFLAFHTNYFLKGVFAVPRPENVGIIRMSDYGFPSGHAMGSLVFFVFLGLFVRRMWLWILFGVMVFLIGLSRIYLGVHYPKDVMGGWVFGAMMVALLLPLRAHFFKWLTSKNQILIGLILSIILASVILDQPKPLTALAVVILGAFSGMLMGGGLRMDRK